MSSPHVPEIVDAYHDAETPGAASGGAFGVLDVLSNSSEKIIRARVNNLDAAIGVPVHPRRAADLPVQYRRNLCGTVGELRDWSRLARGKDLSTPVKAVRTCRDKYLEPACRGLSATSRHR